MREGEQMHFFQDFNKIIKLFVDKKNIAETDY